MLSPWLGAPDAIRSIESISVDDCDAIAATRGRLYELAAFSAPGDYAELARQKPCF
jgi:hypothetical protein